MRGPAVLLIHLIATLVKRLRRGEARSIIAESLLQFQDRFNRDRVHSSLAGLTPNS